MNRGEPNHGFYNVGLCENDAIVRKGVYLWVLPSLVHGKSRRACFLTVWSGPGVENTLEGRIECSIPRRTMVHWNLNSSFVGWIHHGTCILHGF